MNLYKYAAVSFILFQFPNHVYAKYLHSKGKLNFLIEAPAQFVLPKPSADSGLAPQLKSSSNVPIH